MIKWHVGGCFRYLSDKKEQRKGHNDFTIHDTIVLRDINSATRVPELVVPTWEGISHEFSNNSDGAGTRCYRSDFMWFSFRWWELHCGKKKNTWHKKMAASIFTPVELSAVSLEVQECNASSSEGLLQSNISLIFSHLFVLLRLEIHNVCLG